jgi:hypothetical protein
MSATESDIIGALPVFTFFETAQTTAEDQAFDRRRIAILKNGKIQPTQKDRGEVLKAPHRRERRQDARKGCLATDAIA